MITLTNKFTLHINQNSRRINVWLSSVANYKILKSVFISMQYFNRFLNILSRCMKNISMMSHVLWTLPINWGQCGTFPWSCLAYRKIPYTNWHETASRGSHDDHLIMWRNRTDQKNGSFHEWNRCTCCMGTYLAIPHSNNYHFDRTRLALHYKFCDWSEHVWVWGEIITHAF